MPRLLVYSDLILIYLIIESQTLSTRSRTSSVFNITSSVKEQLLFKSTPYIIHWYPPSLIRSFGPRGPRTSIFTLYSLHMGHTFFPSLHRAVLRVGVYLSLMLLGVGGSARRVRCQIWGCFDKAHQARWFLSCVMWSDLQLAVVDTWGFGDSRGLIGRGEKGMECHFVFLLDERIYSQIRRMDGIWCGSDFLGFHGLHWIWSVLEDSILYLV